MINIDEYEKYIKETNWKEHEYINNLLYSFFIRTLDDQKNIAYAGTIRTASRFTSGHSAGVDSDS